MEAQSLTYRELDARANQLAHHLHSLDIGPESVVGLCVSRSFDMLIGLLGILKAGGAFLPLDPSYPSERLAFMLQDADVDAVVSHATVLDRLPAHDAPNVRLDAEWPSIARHPTTAPANLSSPTTLPMSSTRQDRPECRRALPSRIVAFPTLRRSRSIASRSPVIHASFSLLL